MEALGDAIAIPIGIIWFGSMGGRGMGLRRDEAWATTRTALYMWRPQAARGGRGRNRSAVQTEAGGVATKERGAVLFLLDATQGAWNRTGTGRAR